MRGPGCLRRMVGVRWLVGHVEIQCDEKDTVLFSVFLYRLPACTRAQEKPQWHYKTTRGLLLCRVL